MKTIGLIGGMSWESTAEYYRIINETIKEKLGGLRYYCSGDETIHGMTWLAEHLSHKTCELCGEKGKLTDYHGWLKVLCDKHHKERLNAQKG